jgi:hypothetical protein
MPVAIDKHAEGLADLDAKSEGPQEPRDPTTSFYRIDDKEQAAVPDSKVRRTSLARQYSDHFP